MGSRDWWKDSTVETQEGQAQAELGQALEDEAARVEGGCPQCGQPLAEVSATKRKCKPCGYTERV